MANVLSLHQHAIRLNVAVRWVSRLVVAMWLKYALNRADRNPVFQQPDAVSVFLHTQGQQ